MELPSINSPEGQQWLYLFCMLLSLGLLFSTVTAEYGKALFWAAFGALFAKAKTT